ncbi:hypothetical protein VitviT2T_007003 [Vitis vinifera]|uniref:DUF7794 domain-containing protein n=2 Tax=Vitis vinifera TaxID=29760 RepID=D7SNU6_VITVI|eukprot:XP_002267189.2 PREDICTED: uncharacterized protein LOC100245241 [Vitis vinifera]
MDCCISMGFSLLLIFSLLCIQSRAGASGSIFFLDSPTHPFLRPRSSDDAMKVDSVLLPEVGAAVSVLLGFAPSSTLSAASSSKLNEILLPNPFERPRSVLMLEVRGVEDPEVVVEHDNALFRSALKRDFFYGTDKAEILLPGDDKVSVVSLDERLSFDSNTNCTDKEISDFASWMGGLYVANALKPLNGELTIPLAGGANLNLHMSKKADTEFIASLLSLIHNIKRVIEMRQDLSGSMQNAAELLTGCFDGIKVLDEQYGPSGVAQQGVELLLTTLSKMFGSLQVAYKGQIVGVISFTGTPPSSEKMLNVMFTSQPSARWLAETEDSPDLTAIMKIALVRKTLAWITGIILVASTLLGIYFLLNMPLTRDTLLYSNVKLD